MYGVRQRLRDGCEEGNRRQRTDREDVACEEREEGSEEELGSGEEGEGCIAEAVQDAKRGGGRGRRSAHARTGRGNGSFTT